VRLRQPLTTNTTASTNGALRIFPSLLPLFNRSAVRSATAPYDSFSCTITFSRTYTKHRRMPPKKAVKEEKILLGRPGNNLKSGIVGLANVGKSTLFNAISKVKFSFSFNLYNSMLIDVSQTSLANAAVRLQSARPFHRLTTLRTSHMPQLHPKKLGS
jgi:hypothetical protein